MLHLKSQTPSREELARQAKEIQEEVAAIKDLRQEIKSLLYALLDDNYFADQVYETEKIGQMSLYELKIYKRDLIIEFKLNPQKIPASTSKKRNNYSHDFEILDNRLYFLKKLFLRPLNREEFITCAKSYDDNFPPHKKRYGATGHCLNVPVSDHYYPDRYFVATRDFYMTPLFGAKLIDIFVPEDIHFGGGSLGHCHLFHLDYYNK